MAVAATDPDPSPPLAGLLDHHSRFLAFVRRRLADPELAADTLQEAYAKALRAAGQLRDDERLVAWFYRILRQTLVDVYRRRAVRQRILAELPAEWDAPAAAGEEQALCACLAPLVPTLSPGYAELIQALDLAGEPAADVARRLGVSPATLRVRHHRARAQLRDRLLLVCRLCARHGCLDCSCPPPAPPAG